MLLDASGRVIAKPVVAPSFPREPGIGAAMNLHLLWGKRFQQWNAYLKKHGGLNIHGEPNYRIVWGWQRPDLYRVGDSKYLEFFHLERWQPTEMFMDEEEWNHEEWKARDLVGDRYQVQPFPRHGEYVEIAPCRRKGEKEAFFGAPSIAWLERALTLDFYRRDRTKADVKAEVQESLQARRQQEIERNNRVSDELGIRELAETETHMLIRNPSLRKDPGLMLSPA